MRFAASVEKAERASNVRASLMAAGALILVLFAGLQWGDADPFRPALPSLLWILLVVLWAAVLATGGGLGLGRRMRALINDEMSLRNRARAVAAGFYAMLAAALGLYVLGGYAEVSGADAARAVSAAGLSTALFVYSWLER